MPDVERPNYAGDLRALLEGLRLKRREVAMNAAAVFAEFNPNEDMNLFANPGTEIETIQAQIEAVLRAIADEEALAAQDAPTSSWPTRNPPVVA